MPEIAKQLNVKVGTLWTMAKRKGWSQQKQLDKADQEPIDQATLAPWLDARARTWIVETVTLLNKVTGRAARQDIPEGWKGLREIVSLLRELIPAGRQLYGLDQKADGSARQQFAILCRGDVQVVSNPTMATSLAPTEQNTIDVQCVTSSDVVTDNQDVQPVEGEKEIP